MSSLTNPEPATIHPPASVLPSVMPEMTRAVLGESDPVVGLEAALKLLCQTLDVDAGEICRFGDSVRLAGWPVQGDDGEQGSAEKKREALLQLIERSQERPLIISSESTLCAVAAAVLAWPLTAGGVVLVQLDFGPAGRGMLLLASKSRDEASLSDSRGDFHLAGRQLAAILSGLQMAGKGTSEPLVLDEGSVGGRFLEAELLGLYEVAVAVTGILDERQLLRRLCDQISHILSPDIFVATLLNEGEESLVIVVAEEAGRPIFDSEVTMDLGEESGITGWLLRNRETVFIRDLETEEPPVPIRRLSLTEPRTWLGVPFIAYGQVVGSIAVQSRRPDAYTERHARFLELLSNQVAQAIAGARLFQLEARRRQEAELLHHLTTKLLDIPPAEKVFEIGIDAVRQYLPAAGAISISTYEEKKQQITIQASWVADPAYRTVDPPQSIPLDSLVLTREVLESGRTVINHDVTVLKPQENSRLSHLLAQGLRSVAYLPLAIKDRILGMLHIGFWDEPYALTSSEQMTCESIANRVASALEGNRLQMAERAKLKLARTLQEVGMIMTADLTLSRLLERLFELLGQVIEFDTATIQLYNEEEQTLNLAASYGFEETEQIRELFRRQGLASLRKFDGDNLIGIINDTFSHPSWAPLPGGGESKVRSWIGAKLVIKNQFIGILNIDSERLNAFDWDMAETVLAFANQAVVAIEWARLYEILNQRVMQLSALHQVALESATIHSSEELIQHITQKISQLIYPASFGILTLDKSGQNFVLDNNYHWSYGSVSVDRIPRESGVVGHVAKTGKPYVVDDVTSDPYYVAGNDQTRSEIAVPIKLNGEVVAVINVESPKVRHFSDEDVSFLTTLAGQIAMSIQRVQLFEEINNNAAELSARVQQRTSELREEKDRLGAILQSAGEGILFTDLSGTILYANDAMVRQSGYSEEELLGSTPRLLSSGLVSPAVYQELWRNITNGQRWHGELINRHRNGSLYDIALTITPIYDERGRPSGFVSIQSNITKLKEVERLKSEFVTNVSHELRTPLTNIKTYLTLLRKGREERRERYFEILEQESERLSHLIQDLLDLSQLETGVTQLTLSQCDLTMTIDQSVRSFEPQARSGGLTLINDIPARLPLVWADPKQIQQVLTNLLGNAVSYTPAGGMIRCAAGVEDKRVWISISDTGYGVDPQEFDLLFDRFYRGKAAEKSRTAGTGLGLAISKEIIDRHRGEIHVASTLEEGTTVTIWLAISRKPDARPAAEISRG